MSNVWKHPDLIAAEALTVLMDELTITRMAARDKTADFMMRPNGYAIGDTVRIKTRPAYEAKEFSSTISVQDIRSSTRSMAIEKLYDVSVAITAREKLLDLDSFSEEVIRPAVTVLAEAAETYVASKLLQAAGLYASDTLLETAADVAKARQAATLQQLNPMGRFAIVDDELEASLLGQTWFNQSQTRGDPGISTLQSGMMGRVMGIDWYSSLYFPTSDHTAGDFTGVTNNTSGTKNLIGDTTLTVTASSAGGGVNAGDRILIAGVRRPLVVKTGAPSVSTSIALVDPITEIIPDGAAITVIGAEKSMTIRGAIFDTDALAVAMPMLDTPSDKPSYVVASDGFSIRVVQGYDMEKKTETMSLDFLIGAAAYDPRRITLLAGY